MLIPQSASFFGFLPVTLSRFQTLTRLINHTFIWPTHTFIWKSTLFASPTTLSSDLPTLSSAIPTLSSDLPTLSSESWAFSLHHPLVLLHQPHFLPREPPFELKIDAFCFDIQPKRLVWKVVEMKTTLFDSSVSLKGSFFTCKDWLDYSSDPFLKLFRENLLLRSS